MFFVLIAIDQAFIMFVRKHSFIQLFALAGSCAFDLGVFIYTTLQAQENNMLSIQSKRQKFDNYPIRKATKNL